MHHNTSYLTILSYSFKNIENFLLLFILINFIFIIPEKIWNFITINMKNQYTK